MLAIALNNVLMWAGVCLVVLFMIALSFWNRLREKNRAREFLAGRDEMTDADFCRSVGSELLDERICSAVRHALGSQLGCETEALLRPEDSVREVMDILTCGGDLPELFVDLEARLRTNISQRDMDWILGGETPPESLTLGEFAARLADHVKEGPQQRAADEDARMKRAFPGFLWVSVAGLLEVAALSLAVLVYHLVVGGLMMLGMEGGMAFALFFLVALVVSLILAIGVRHGSRLAFVATMVALGWLLTRCLPIPGEDLSPGGAVLLCLTAQILVPMFLRARFFFTRNQRKRGQGPL
jgi:hypothetical protein